MSKSIMVLAALLASCMGFSHAYAQTPELVPIPTPARLLSVEAGPAQAVAKIPLDPLGLTPGDEAGSSGGVIVGAVLGGLAVAAMLSATHVGGDPPPSWWAPAAFASGVSAGGMAGAALSSRRAAPVSTGIGTVIGSVPLLVFSMADLDDACVVPGMVFSIVGTVLGNQVGQPPKR